ncbi:MAG TPA: YfiR family protein [Polyangiaceae bacterium]
MRSQRREFVRRLLFGALVMLGVSLTTLRSIAEDITVPVRTQAQLIVKVAGYDRGLVARPGPRRVLILRTRATASQRVADGILAELRSFEAIAGAAHQDQVIEFTSAQDLRKRIDAQGVQVLYVCPGLEDQLVSIGNTLTGLTVLSFGAGPDHAHLGTVIAFDILSGRVQLLVNLRQAQKQNVQLHAEFLKIAKVIR